MWWLLIGFTVIIGLYLIICLLVYIFQARLIFIGTPPVHFPVDGLRSRTVTMNRDGLTLSGYHIEESMAPYAGVIVYFGGNAEEISTSMVQLKETGFRHIVGYHYRGYAFSEGKSGEKQVVSDAVAILREAVGLVGTNGQLIVVGRSIGSSVAIQAAKQVQVDGVVLVTPFGSLARVGQRAFPFLPVHLLLRHRFESERHAQGIRAPALFVLAEHDEMIAREESERLIEAWPVETTKVVVPGASHNAVDLDGAVATCIARQFGTKG